MATLLEDIDKQSEWLITAFASDGLKLDYTIRSFIEIDKFFNINTKDGRPVANGRLVNNFGNVIFSIGSYVGQTIIKTVPGAYWVTDDRDEQGEITASVVLPDGSAIWPIERVINRSQDGPKESVYVYGYHFTKEYHSEPFDKDYWELDGKIQKSRSPWWKFW